MTPIAAYHHLGLLAALLLLIGLYGVVRLWPQGSDKTFSQHVATSNTGVLYYILLFTLTLPLLLLFFLGWFAPTYHLPASFHAALIIAIITQYLCTLVPERHTFKRAVHRFLAFASATCLLVSIVIIALWGDFSLIVHSLLTIAALAMSVIIVIFVATKDIHSKLLNLQAAYFTIFFVAILAATYLPH